MIRVNLVKAEKKDIEARIYPDQPEVKIKKKTPIGNLIVGLAVLVLAVLIFLQMRALNAERELLDAAKADQARLQLVSTKLEQVEQQKAFLERKIGLINVLKARQGGAVNILGEISTSLPDWVWLTEATLRPTGLELKGRALSNILISDFMRNLEKSGLFDNVGLIASTQRNQGNNQFLEFTLNAAVILPKLPDAPGAASKKPEAR